MKTISHILSILVAIAVFTSCSDFLNVKPKGKVIPETTEDYEHLLNYAQLHKTSDTYPNYMTDDIFVPEKDNVTGGFNGLSVPLQNLYTFNKETFGESQDDKLWGFSYNRIYTYNVIIEDIMGTSEGIEVKKRELKAEALVGRAIEYLTLVNAYAKHYDYATASSDPGVPLILDKGIEKSNLKRASVQEVYEQIQKDLAEAAEDLPEKPVANSFRASKAVGFGILSRMYLYMGDYSKALDNAKKSLEKNNQLLDLKKYQVVKPQSYSGRINVPELIMNPENIYIRMAPRTYGLSGSVNGSEDLTNMYDKAKDKRFLLYFTKNIGSLTTEYNLWAPYIRANLAISTPEIYLIAAECEARVGSKEEAMKYLNHLRDNRILDNTPLEASDNKEALKMVLDERRRELAFWGCTRLIDLKRLNREPEFSKTIVHEVAGKKYTLAPNDPKYILPIPPVVLQFNPNMIPNER
ncbi:RagB/SusD family nutrient uptake outer membrane protein [Porphyromonas sp.]|uniref:RagB/SusD family nutrient uptake outer membrane protein n=1 Tax=Porphyromonas sp. TaxID=1924944 RepID=UPI0034C65892